MYLDDTRSHRLSAPRRFRLRQSRTTAGSELRASLGPCAEVYSTLSQHEVGMYNGEHE